MRKAILALTITLFSILLFPSLAFGTESDPQIPEVSENVLTDERIAVVENKLAARELGETQEITALYDYTESQRFVLAVTQGGYLIMDIPTGIVLEWGEDQNPYQGYE
ncbi:MAG: hypothetical protein LBU48_02370, partial [Coriobacteriales bacterium]|nr:hypothetical protein [Coriobacteriales bacterium]